MGFKLKGYQQASENPPESLYKLYDTHTYI
jgi:hypothetical protein